MSLRSTANYENIAVLDLDEEVTPMIFSQDFRNCVITLIPSVDFTGSILFYTSNSGSNRPNLALAASASNTYADATIIDLTDWTQYNNTISPLTYAGWEGIKEVEINQNLNTWVWCKLGTGITGSVTVSVALADNQ